MLSYGPDLQLNAFETSEAQGEPLSSLTGCPLQILVSSYHALAYERHERAPFSFEPFPLGLGPDTPPVGT